MSLIPGDEFLTNDLFIRLSWNLFFSSTKLSNESQHYKDLENLISITNLNKQTLIHTLYYLYLLVNHKPFLFPSSATKLSTFQSSSRIKLISNANKRNSNELYELIIVLFMISNKANDDSSYTLKTWSNLTPLNNAILKKKELVVLKKIQYNVFLKDEEYTKWCSLLYSIGSNSDLIWEEVTQLPQISSSSSPYNYPPTPKSPIQDLSYHLPSLQPSILPLPITYHPYIPSQHVYKRSYDDEYGCVKKQHLGYETIYNTPTRQGPTNYYTPIKSSCNQMNQVLDNYDYNDYGYTSGYVYNHPTNCTCCQLTNLTNSYHSSLKSLVKL